MRAFLRTVLLLIPVVLISCTACVETVFDGDRIVNDDAFLLRFTMLNRTESAALSAVSGQEAFLVQIALDGGTVDLVITGPDGTPAYRGTELQSASFEVVLPRSGTYTIDVTGKKAAGMVEITRKNAPEYGA